MNSCQEIVLFVVEYIIRECYTWCDQFRNTSLNQLFRQLWILQLVTDCHTFTSTNELRQIGIKGVMRKACHLVSLVVSIVTMGEGNTENFGSSNGIFTIGLIKVATPEKHDCIRMFRLQIKELFHHWGQFFPFFLCHYDSYFGLSGKISSFFPIGKKSPELFVISFHFFVPLPSHE